FVRNRKTVTGLCKCEHGEREWYERQFQFVRKRGALHRHGDARNLYAAEEDSIGSVYVQFRQSTRSIRKSDTRAEIAVVVWNKADAVDVVSKTQLHKQIGSRFDVVLNECGKQILREFRARVAEALRKRERKRKIIERHTGGKTGNCVWKLGCKEFQESLLFDRSQCRIECLKSG